MSLNPGFAFLTTIMPGKRFKEDAELEPNWLILNNLREQTGWGTNSKEPGKNRSVIGEEGDGPIVINLLWVDSMGS